MEWVLIWLIERSPEYLCVEMTWHFSIERFRLSQKKASSHVGTSFGSVRKLAIAPRDTMGVLPSSILNLLLAHLPECALNDTASISNWFLGSVFIKSHLGNR